MTETITFRSIANQTAAIGAIDTVRALVAEGQPLADAVQDAAAVWGVSRYVLARFFGLS